MMLSDSAIRTLKPKNGKPKRKADRDELRSRVTKITKIYVELLAHLFTRPAELRLAQWSEFNLQQGEWHIPIERMKMAAAHWVPLSDHVIKLLKEYNQKLNCDFKTYSKLKLCTQSSSLFKSSISP